MSLRAAVERLLSTAIEGLRTEFPGERIELRPVQSDRAHLYRCYVNRRPAGPLIRAEDIVGRAILTDLASTEALLSQVLSEAVMMHLQTQG